MYVIRLVKFWDRYIITLTYPSSRLSCKPFCSVFLIHVLTLLLSDHFTICSLTFFPLSLLPPKIIPLHLISTSSILPSFSCIVVSTVLLPFHTFYYALTPWFGSSRFGPISIFLLSMAHSSYSLHFYHWHVTFLIKPSSSLLASTSRFSMPIF